MYLYHLYNAIMAASTGDGQLWRLAGVLAALLVRVSEAYAYNAGRVRGGLVRRDRTPCGARASGVASTSPLQRPSPPLRGLLERSVELPR